MKYRLVSILECPVCHNVLELKVFKETEIVLSAPIRDMRCPACVFCGGASHSPEDCAQCTGREILDGILLCPCGERYGVVDGVPILLPGDTSAFEQLQRRYGEKAAFTNKDVREACAAGLDADVKTSQRFGYEWTRYPACFAEEEARIFFEETQFGLSELKNRLILDAGCGMGRFTRVAGSRGGEVVGVDLSESVLSAYKLTEHMPNVHIVKADLMQLPFKDASFDVVYSLGVLHHTPNTEKTFSALVRKLKAGALLSVWVYGTAGRYADFITNPLRPDRMRFVRHAAAQRAYWLLVLAREKCSNALRRITVSIPHKVLYAFCHVLALLGKLPLLKYCTFSVHPDWRVRLLENFDWLAPPFQYHHTKEEMLVWCAEEGIAVEKMLQHGFIPKVGIRGVKK